VSETSETELRLPTRIIAKVNTPLQTNLSGAIRHNEMAASSMVPQLHRQDNRRTWIVGAWTTSTPWQIGDGSP
jgi:hypothetical protein